MGKGTFTVRNIDSLTTEQVKGKPLRYEINSGEFIPMGTLTHADNDYIYGEFEHSEDGNLAINLIAEKCSMKIRGD